MAENNNNLCAAEIKKGGFIEKLPGIGGKFEEGCEGAITAEAKAMISSTGGETLGINPNTRLGLVTALKQIASTGDNPSTTRERALALANHFEAKYK